MSKIEYLDEERKKIWAKIIELEEALNKRTPDYEKEAKQSSKKASEFRNRCEESKEAAFNHLSAIEAQKSEINNFVEAAKKSINSISEVETNSSQKFELVNESFDRLSDLESKMREKIQNLENIFSNHPELENEIKTLENQFSESEELQSKINAIHKSSLSRKKEIDQLYIDIFGYEEKNEEGEDTYVEGLHDKLDKSFNDIQGKVKDYHTDLDNFKKEKETNITDFISKWDTETQVISDKIKSLLPDALTAGLSHAYSEKKKEEKEVEKKHKRAFFWSLIGMVFVSLIPFTVNLILWLQGKDIEALLIDVPRLVLAIMPLYIPFFWMAYNSNKKTNLSKRLIEEYTHKEVLSKTFEGLSRQISEIDDEDLSSDLRVRLIYNILNVSSENPGKLITDYNKADHPLMEALDKSVQLANAVDKLAGIPGFTKISKIIEKKSKQILENEALKAEQGFASLEEDEDEEIRETNE